MCAGVFSAARIRRSLAAHWRFGIRLRLQPPPQIPPCLSDLDRNANERDLEGQRVEKRLLLFYGPFYVPQKRRRRFSTRCPSRSLSLATPSFLRPVLCAAARLLFGRAGACRGWSYKSTSGDS